MILQTPNTAELIERNILGRSLPEAGVAIKQSIALGGIELPLVSQLPVGTESVSFICHPGWCRKQDKALDLVCRRIESGLKDQEERGANVASKFVDISMDEQGYLINITLDELQSERHCFLANAVKRPVIISLPTFFRDGEFQVDSNTQNFLDYLRDFTSLCDQVYVIPTVSTYGYVQENVCLDRLKAVSSIVVSGGRIEACMAQTLGAITADQQKLIFDVQACTDQFGEDLGISEEQKQKCLNVWYEWRERGFTYSLESHTALINSIINEISDELGNDLFLRKVRQISKICHDLAGPEINFEIQLAVVADDQLQVMVSNNTLNENP